MNFDKVEELIKLGIIQDRLETVIDELLTKGIGDIEFIEELTDVCNIAVENLAERLGVNQLDSSYPTGGTSNMDLR